MKEEGKEGRLFCPCELADRVFQGANNSSVPFVAAIHSFDPSLLSSLSFRLLDPGGVHTSGKRETEREEEEWRLSDVRKQRGSWAEFRGVDTPLKGKRRWYPPPPAVHGRAGHFSLRSPLSYGYSFRLPFDSQIARNNRYFPDIERSFYYPPRLMIAQLL